MKIKVTDRIEREIEILFPCAYKDGECYYYLKDEDNAVCCFGLESISVSPVNCINLSKAVQIPISEMEEFFSRAVKTIQGRFTPETLIDTTEMNLPVTETLTEKELINELHRQGGLYGN